MTLFIVLVAVAGLAVGAFAGALAVQARRKRDARLEVVPGVRSGAPVAWAGAHTPEGRLHRRLGDAVRSLRAQPALEGPVMGGQRSALEQEALRIDAHLVAVAALTGPRRAPAIAEVGGLVDRLESAVADLVTASVADASALDAVIAESEIRLRAIEEARAEVERIDGQQPG